MKKLYKKDINTKKYWDGMYTEHSDDIDIQRFSALARVIKSGDKVLDVGGGSGELLDFIGKNIPNTHRTLLDMSAIGVKKALKLKRAEKGVVGSVYRLPFKDKSFDVVLCAETLEHLKYPKKCVKELNRVSKRIISVSVPYKNAIQDQAHLWEYDIEDMRTLFEPIGDIKVSLTSNDMIMVTNCLKTPDYYVVDADDFCEENNSLNTLMFIKNKIPNFKITLFTIPGLCSIEFIKRIKKLDWIDLVPHGWTHDTSLECLNWSYKQSKNYLEKIKGLKMTKGFKAPGWQISNGMYRALKEAGYWVADQAYNNDRRLKSLKYYLLDDSNKKHYHIGHLGGYNDNELNEHLSEILKLKGNFKFIKKCLK